MGKSSNKSKRSQDEIRTEKRANKGKKEVETVKVRRPHPFTAERSTVTLVTLGIVKIGDVSRYVVKYHYSNLSITDFGNVVGVLRTDEDGTVLAFDLLNKKMLFRQRTIKEVQAIKNCDEATARAILEVREIPYVRFHEEHRSGTYKVENGKYINNGKEYSIPENERDCIFMKTVPVHAEYYLFALESLCETIAEQEHIMFEEKETKKIAA